MERNNYSMLGHTTKYLDSERRIHLKYTPATLTEEHVHQIQEIEQHLSEAAGKELILIAYALQPEEANPSDNRSDPL